MYVCAYAYVYSTEELRYCSAVPPNLILHRQHLDFFIAQFDRFVYWLAE